MVRVTRTPLLAVLLLGVATCSAALGYEYETESLGGYPDYNRIRGYVRTATGSPVAAVKVYLFEGTTFKYSTFTGTDGSYQFDSNQIQIYDWGTYKVIPTAPDRSFTPTNTTFRYPGNTNYFYLFGTLLSYDTFLIKNCNFTMRETPGQPGPPRLAFKVQPRNTRVWQPFSRSVVVEALGEDRYEPGAVVNIAKVAGTSGTLRGETSVALRCGEAVFPDLSVDEVASGCRLYAWCDGKEAATSEPFDVYWEPYVVTWPNGGERLFTEEYEITWTGFLGGDDAQVKVELSRDSGATWVTLSASTADDGATRCVFPIPTTYHARVRVTSLQCPGLSDASDEDFRLEKKMGYYPVLSFTGQPSGMEPGQTIPPVEVTVRDNSGTPWPWPAIDVTMELKSYWASTGVLSGTLTKSTPADGTGKVTFNNLRISQPGDYSLRAFTVWGSTERETVSNRYHMTTASEGPGAPDEISPAIAAPEDITTVETNPAGTPVALGEAIAVDDQDPAPEITNDAPTLFPLGVTTVTWTATDDAGNTGTATQTVTVIRATPLTLTSITPNTGANTGSVSITDLAGTGFFPGATVKLARTGHGDITATDVTIVSETKITCTFDLTDKAGGACTVVVTGTDTQSDSLSDGFTITGTAPEIDVRGNGVSIADGDTTPSATDHTDFGSVHVATGTADRTFTIRNEGNGSLNLTDTPIVSISGAQSGDFSVSVVPTTPVAASGQTTFTARFDPSATGLRQATVSIANDDSDENPYDFAIQGTGTAPEINLKQSTTDIADGGSHDFGSKSLNSNTDIVFTIENTGAADLTLTTPLTITGTNADQFSLQAQPTSPVAGPTGTTTFAVRFSPTSAGAKTATISVANNDSDENPYDLTITGTGETGAPTSAEVTIGVGGNQFSLIGLPNVPAGFDPFAAGLLDHTTSSYLIRWHPTATAGAPYYCYQYLYDPTGSGPRTGNLYFGPADLARGTGYWHRAQQAYTARFPENTDTLDVPVLAGVDPNYPRWNLNGNPYATTLTFSSLSVVSGGAAQSLASAANAGVCGSFGWRYPNPSVGYQLVAVPGAYPGAGNEVPVGAGFWTYFNQNATLRFNPPGAPGLPQTVHKPTPTKAASERHWVVQLKARQAGRRDDCNYFGTASRAQDLPKPPVPPEGDYVGLTFVEPGRQGPATRQAAQLRESAAGASNQWELLVETNSAERVELTWPDLSEVPNELSLYLEDAESGRRVYLRTQTAYRFAPAGRAHRFRITADPRSEGALRISNVSVRPDGRGPGTRSVTFSLSQPAAVQVRVLTNTGRTLLQAQVGAAQPGLNTIPLTARDARSPLARGQYLCELVAATPEGRATKHVAPFAVH
jgi:hypothetical protein